MSRTFQEFHSYVRLVARYLEELWVPILTLMLVCSFIIFHKLTAYFEHLIASLL